MHIEKDSEFVLGVLYSQETSEYLKNIQAGAISAEKGKEEKYRRRRWKDEIVVAIL
jgi:uncharacterized NAD(P)/FAD-binding protein YdhS